MKDFRYVTPPKNVSGFSLAPSEGQSAGLVVQVEFDAYHRYTCTDQHRGVASTEKCGTNSLWQTQETTVGPCSCGVHGNRRSLQSSLSFRLFLRLCSSNKGQYLRTVVVHFAGLPKGSYYSKKNIV